MQGMERRQQHALRQIAGGAEEQERVRGWCHFGPIGSKPEPSKGADRAGSNHDRQSDLNDADTPWREFENNAPRRNSLL